MEMRLREIVSRPWIALFLSSNTSRRISIIATKKFSSIGSTRLHPFVCQTFSLYSSIEPENMSTASSKYPELIDVDCNLWHKDLKSLQTPSTDSKGDDDNSSNPNFWNILMEDAIKQANIVAMLSPSSTIEEAKLGLKYLKDASAAPPIPIKTTVGVHPYHVNDKEFSDKSIKEHKDIIVQLLKDNMQFCAAVGECGLDASEGFPSILDQIPWFEMQIDIAQELNLPLFVHERLAFEDTMRVLENVSVPIIIHCFTGTKQECIAYIEKGYYISVSGYILKESNGNRAESLSCLQEGIIPLNKLMIETDAPYMGFPNCRQLYLEHNQEYLSSLNSKKKKRLQQSIYPNVPSSLPIVLNKVTECLQQCDSSLTIDEVGQETTKNARSFFGL